MGTRIQHRRDTAANWTSNDPTLTAGEIGWESDTNLFKIGDGVTAWTGLSYANLPSTITVANEATDTTCFLSFFTAATGVLQPKTNANLTYNSSTGEVSVIGALNVDDLVLNGSTITSSLVNGNIIIQPTGSGVISANGDISLNVSNIFLSTGIIQWVGAGGITDASFITVDNLSLDGNIISSTDTNGNIVLTPNGTGITTTSKIFTITDATDATDVTTAAEKVSGGISAAKNIFTAQRSNTSPDRFVARATGTLGSTSSALTLSGLTAYDDYTVKISGRWLTASTVAYLRVRVNNSTTTSEYSSYDDVIPGGSITLRNIRGLALSGKSASGTGHSFKMTLECAGSCTSGDPVSISPSEVVFTPGSSFMGRGGYVSIPGMTQLDRLDFELFSTTTTNTVYTAADLITLNVEVYGTNLYTDANWT